MFFGKQHHRFASQELTPLPNANKGAGLHSTHKIPPGIQYVLRTTWDPHLPKDIKALEMIQQ